MTNKFKHGMVWFIALVLVAGCSLLGDPGINDSIGGVGGNVDSILVSNIVNTGLLWWQWLLIGVCIPTIPDWIRMIRNALLGK